MRNMSFSLTRDQMREQTKTVTRRLGWNFLKPGDLIQPVEKGQGLKKGERVKKLGCPIRVVSVRREPLEHIDLHDLRREGFMGKCLLDFALMFMRANKCGLTQEVTRIEFEFVEVEE